MDKTKLIKGASRLLEVDNKVTLPTGLHIKVLVFCADALHGPAVMPIGVKINVCPGRLTQESSPSDRKRVFHGQCVEIDGTNNDFMPIIVRSVDLDYFGAWLCNKLIK
jgi:heme/copper-type cytochrome/quinol oxidase subunit 2